MDGFLLEIITPEKQFFKGEAEQIICETESGKLGILKGHQTMVSALEIGEIQIKVNGEWKSLIATYFPASTNDSKSISSFTDAQ